MRYGHIIFTCAKKLTAGHLNQPRGTKNQKTRSTGTVHTVTSVKTRLTDVAMCMRDPDRHQNLLIRSLTHYQPFLKISCKSVRKFLRKVANRQTDKQR